MLHQYILQHRHKKKKTDETINATVHSSASCRNQFSQGVVGCLWWYMISCARATKLSQVSDREFSHSGRPEVAQPYISKEGLRLGEKRTIKSLVRIDFSIVKSTHTDADTHTTRLESCTYWSPTANNRFICRQGFATIIIYWPGQRTAVLSCFVPFTLWWIEAANVAMSKKASLSFRWIFYIFFLPIFHFAETSRF